MTFNHLRIMDPSKNLLIVSPEKYIQYLAYNDNVKVSSELPQRLYLRLRILVSVTLKTQEALGKIEVS